ncbi:MAG: Flp pilus assembly protein CpaB [Candidatus Omnitrophica bacterium]|nr:Flp pilus assembly protein CpaB [Candidatus Omnitrophota bacterium]MDD5429908.1 Flp pilus assembly protein CpaB [Candidatus Omnitrophota bacterium]
MDKRTINIIIGVVLALFAIFMINRHLAQREALIQQLIREGQIIEVVAARVDISKETTITANMVELRRIRSQSFQTGDLTSIDSAVGKFAEVDILKGQHINSNMVRSLGAAKYLSQAVPQGMRAITIPVDKISAVEGLLKPGDVVDIISTFPIPNQQGQSDNVVITIFQGVKILATNRNLSQYTVSTNVDTVTLALKPEDIKILTYILDWSRIRLVLRAPLDSTTEYGYTAVTWEALMKKLGMWLEEPIQAQEETIEVYRATKVEEAPIFKNQ